MVANISKQPIICHINKPQYLVGLFLAVIMGLKRLIIVIIVSRNIDEVAIFFTSSLISPFYNNLGNNGITGSGEILKFCYF